MTPPLNADPVCGGCFLYERRGVCPTARDAYGLMNSPEAERRAEQFRQALAQDARTVVTLPELIQADAAQTSVGAVLGGSALALPAACKPQAQDHRKEASYAVPARSVR